MSQPTPPQPPPYTPADIQRLEMETETIRIEVERATGLRSRWSGRVSVVEMLPLGAKDWSCDILVSLGIIHLPQRFLTLLHEVLHSVSAGLNEQDFFFYRGYEEAVTEQCTRLLHGEIFARLLITAPIGKRTAYDYEIGLMESLRSQTLKDEREFYLALLTTFLANREAAVLQWIQEAHPNKSLTQIQFETALLRRRLQI